MYKLVTFLKRKPGLTHQDFVDYYEMHHAVLGWGHLRGGVEKYVRRYLTPLPHPITGETVEPDYDCVMELWFRDLDQCNATMGKMLDPAVGDEMVADEKRFIDRTMMRVFAVDERESSDA